MNARKQNSTTYPVPFFMTQSADHIAGATGLAPTVTVSKNGGAFAAAAGAVTETGNGWYALAGNATDRNTLGEWVLHATATGADPAERRIAIVPYDPFDANLGLSALPTVAPNTAGGLPIVDSNGGVKVRSGTGIGEVNLSSGNVTLAADPLAVVPGSYLSTQVGGMIGTINTVVGHLQFDGSNNVRALVNAYGAGQDPAAIVWGASTAYNTTGTMGGLQNYPIVAGYASGQSPAVSVWGASTASFTAAGSFGLKVGGLVGGADPWATAISGAYTGSQAGGFLDAIKAAADKLTFDGSNNVHANVYAYNAGMTPEGRVWSALGTTYNASGTMGGELADAAGGTGGTGGSDPWASAIGTGYTSTQAGNIVNTMALAVGRLQFDGSNNVLVSVNAYTTGQDPAATVWGAAAATYNAATTMGALQNAPVVGGYAAGQTPEGRVWGAALSAYNAGGSFGGKINSISLADPWLTAVGTGYVAGQAGFLLNQTASRVDAPVSGVPAALFAADVFTGISYLKTMRAVGAQAMGDVDRNGTSQQFFTRDPSDPAATLMTATMDPQYLTRTMDSLTL